jgi:hypothetical protein
MKEFKVFEHLDGQVEPVKQGWSWPGFFFTYIWLFFKRCRVLGILILSFYFIMGFISGLLRGTAKSTIDMVLYLSTALMVILLGGYGNKLVENKLLSRGFEFKTTVTAANQFDATERYLAEKQQSL